MKEKGVFMRIHHVGLCFGQSANSSVELGDGEMSEEAGPIIQAC